MKICSKQGSLVIKSNSPKFKYRFPLADDPVEVEEKHTDKILLNSSFYKHTGKVKSLSKTKGKD